jgi:hypothetical protein
MEMMLRNGAVATGLVLATLMVDTDVRAQQRDSGAVTHAKQDTAKPKNRNVVAPTQSAQRTSHQDFVRWLGRQIALSRDVFDRLAAVRSDGRAIAGERLIRLALRTGQQEDIWRCDGCWSPANAAGNGIAVLRSDGVWLLPSGREPRRAVAAERLERIIGRMDLGGMRLLVARRRDDSPGNPCPLDLIVVDLAAGGVSPVLDAEAQCVGAAQVTTSDRVRGTQMVAETSMTDRNGIPQPRGLKWARTPDGDFEPLLPTRRSGPGGLDRYDPIWVSEDTVVYVARRWPPRARP